MTVQMAFAEIGRVLVGKRLPLTDEKRLQAEIGSVLDAAGLRFQREAPLVAARGAIDFLVLFGDAYRVGIEVKIKGSRLQILRQLVRYAGSPSVDALMLVTSLGGSWQDELGGKPLTTINISEAWL
jgi:hypothetical protein